MTATWRTIACPRCGGHGIVSAYTASGDDFLGAAECENCGGSGRLFVSPRDRLAEYPGGPFKGSWPGAYATAESIGD